MRPGLERVEDLLVLHFYPTDQLPITPIYLINIKISIYDSVVLP